MAGGPYDSLAVANEILRLAHAKGLKLTPMQVIKLVYLANGWSLALLDRALISDEVQAWQYGPVIPRVYTAFSRFGSSPVTEPAVDDFSGIMITANFLPDDLRVIDSVVTGYGHVHGFQLSEIMHRPGTPWTNARKRGGAYSVIPQEEIRRHFVQLKNERSSRGNQEAAQVN